MEQARARELRAKAWTLNEIAAELGVSKSSVSIWVRDVEFTPRPRHRGHLSERDLTMFALALYAGEGSKRDGTLVFANSDPVLMRIFATWLRRQFPIDESRLKMKLYLHADLDLDASITFWSQVTGVPSSQFNKPYRAVADATLRHNRHVHGCASLVCHSALVHRRVMAMIAAVTSGFLLPG